MIPQRLFTRLILLAFIFAILDALAPEAEAGLGSFFSGMGSRSRVIQVCIVTMAVALFVMLKKFSPQNSDPRAFAPKMNYAPFEDDKVTR